MLLKTQENIIHLLHAFRITDTNGKGRFADYTSVVDTDGRITGFIKNAGSGFYNQNTVRVDIIPVGNGAGATTFDWWNFNEFEKLKTKLDTENGYLFENYNNVLVNTLVMVMLVTPKHLELL